MRLNLLIPCYNDSVNDIPANLLPQRSDVRYFVSHQISPDRAGIEMPAELDRPDVIYSSFTGKGVALNLLANHMYLPTTALQVFT